MLIQIFCVLGRNILIALFLMNGLKKKTENLFSENQIFRQICSTSFLGKIFKILRKKFSLKNLQGPDVLELLIAVDELNIQQLIPYIREFLIEHQTEFLHQNPTGSILETVYQHESFMDLWNFCLDKIC